MCYYQRTYQNLHLLWGTFFSVIFFFTWAFYNITKDYNKIQNIIIIIMPSIKHMLVHVLILVHMALTQYTCTYQHSASVLGSLASRGRGESRWVRDVWGGAPAGTMGVPGKHWWRPLGYRHWLAASLGDQYARPPRTTHRKIPCWQQ